MSESIKQPEDSGSAESLCSPISWMNVLKQYRNACEKRGAPIGHQTAISEILRHEQALCNREQSQQMIRETIGMNVFLGILPGERWPRCSR